MSTTENTGTTATTQRRPLEGKVVVVTGGNSGIGEGIVREAAAQGAKVVIDYVSRPQDTDAIIRDLEASGAEAVGCEADVSKVADLEKLIATAVDTFGRLDVMVNNAGVEFGETLESLTEEKYDLLMNINLKGAVFGSKLAAAQMRTQGDGGVIINITSTHEDWPMPSDLAYCISKGGMRMLTRTAGVELGPDRIRMVGVGPGAIDTPINDDDTPEETRALAAAVPLSYIGSPQEMGKVVCFAASEAASYITATTIMADGGLMQKPGAV
jgi:glucose 1-dehydrogenase